MARTMKKSLIPVGKAHAWLANMAVDGMVVIGHWRTTFLYKQVEPTSMSASFTAQRNFHVKRSASTHGHLSSHTSLGLNFGLLEEQFLLLELRLILQGHKGIVPRLLLPHPHIGHPSLHANTASDA